MVKALNEIGFTFACFGNHEFDIPYPLLEKRLQEFKTTMLNSNIEFILPESEPLNKLCVPYATLKLPNGATIRFFGYLTEETQETLQIVNGNKPLPLNILPVLDKATKDIQQTLYGDDYDFSNFTTTSDPIADTDTNVKAGPHTPRVSQVVPDAPDAIVALTHQFMPFDRILCQNNYEELNLVLGGHEHDPFLEIVDGINILKSGSDSNYCGIVYMDFISKEKNLDGTYKEVQVKRIRYESSSDNLMIPPTTTIISLPHSPFTVIQHVQIANMSVLKPLLKPVPQIDELVSEGRRIIEKYGSQVLYELPDNNVLYSSKDIRTGPNKFAKFLCDCVKQCCSSDIVVLPAGKIRGNKEYVNRLITYIDVLSELPFPDNEIITLKVTGDLIERALQYSEEKHVSRGGYLQVDSDVVFTDSTRKHIKSLNHQLFDPAHEYVYTVPLTHLKGIDNNPVLIEIGKINDIDNIMKDDAPLLQHILVQYFSAHYDGGTSNTPSKPETTYNTSCSEEPPSTLGSGEVN
uniref:5'-nucleotidase n=1 Tax=Lygus hesperus TaxID=30085 RepID=A0A0A9YL66_LYGHE